MSSLKGYNALITGGGRGIGAQLPGGVDVTLIIDLVRGHQHRVRDHVLGLHADPGADRCHRRLAAEYMQSFWPDMEIVHLV